MQLSKGSPFLKFRLTLSKTIALASNTTIQLDTRTRLAYNGIEDSLFRQSRSSLSQATEEAGSREQRMKAWHRVVKGTTANIIGIMNHHLLAHGTSFTDGGLRIWHIRRWAYQNKWLRKIRIGGQMPSCCLKIGFFSPRLPWLPMLPSWNSKLNWKYNLHFFQEVELLAGFKWKSSCF